METFKDFQLSGYEVYTMIDAAARKHNGKAMHEHNSFLDFGCGAGRILQYIPEGSLRAGCDVNAPIVDFASQQFLSTDIYRNEFQPPLKWNADSFDMVYSFSVFSHLRLEDEKRWLKELRALGVPDVCILSRSTGTGLSRQRCHQPNKRRIANAALFIVMSTSAPALTWIFQRGMNPRIIRRITFAMNGGRISRFWKFTKAILPRDMNGLICRTQCPIFLLDCARWGRILWSCESDNPPDVTSSL